VAKKVSYLKSLDNSQPMQALLEVNDNQEIVPGDLLYISSGRVSKSDGADTDIIGIAQGYIETGVRATATLTFSSVPVDNQTVTIGSDVYELTVDGTHATGTIPVLLSNTTADVAVVALAKAINNNPRSQFTAVSSTTSDTVVITAKHCGTAYNGIATTETCTNAAWGDTETGSGTGTTVQGIPQLDNDYLTVLLINDKSVLRVNRLSTSRLLLPTDLYTTAFDLTSAQLLDADDTNDGFLIPVGYDNTTGSVDVVVKASALWNA